MPLFSQWRNGLSTCAPGPLEVGGEIGLTPLVNAPPKTAFFVLSALFVGCMPVRDDPWPGSGYAADDPERRYGHGIGGEKGVADLLLYAAAHRADDPDRLGRVETAITGGATGRSVQGGFPGWAKSANLDLGGGLDGGFLYELNAMLLGGGYMWGSASFVGLSFGPGVNGIYKGRLPATFQLPVELFTGYDVFTHMRGSAWIRPSFLFGSPSRDFGAPSAPFADELAAGVGFQFGRWGWTEVAWGFSGIGVGAVYREQRDARTLGVMLGSTLTETVPGDD